MLYSYSYDLLSIYNLEPKKYKKKYIFDYILGTFRKKKFKKNTLYKLNKKFTDLIMYNIIEYHGKYLTFYDLVYCKSIKWKFHYINGFTKKLISQMLDTFIVENTIINKYLDLGKKIDIIIL